MAAEKPAIERTARSNLLLVPLALAAILLLADFLRLYRLDENGFGTPYHSAGVRSMLESWHNFFFNAFDPDGFVSLDKPPVALWIQVVSAKLFGYSSLSLLAPQAIEGTLSVALTYHLVQLPSASLALLAPDDPANGPGIRHLRMLRDAELGRIEAFLAVNHKGEHYLLATQNARQAAPLVIATGGNVMAFGGARRAL